MGANHGCNVALQHINLFKINKMQRAQLHEKYKLCFPSIKEESELCGKF
jgi:hypothetical protein